MTTESFARSPNNLNFRSVSIIFTITIVPIIGLGLSYGFAGFHCPDPRLTGILPFVLGSAVGYLTAKAASRADLRNEMPFVAVCAGAGALAFYISWVAFFYAGSHQIIWAPTELLSDMHAFAQSGWKYEGAFGHESHLAGLQLEALWLLEACVVLAVSGCFGYNMADY